ncbi:MAG: ABC transporter ATP-binding protein, partial [Eubacteriales bacterium]
MKNAEEKSKTGRKLSLIWQFLKGSKLFFLLTIISAAITALADMIIPQIIRASVDNAIGGEPAEFPAAVMNLVERLGGFEYLGRNLWIMALAVLICALVKVIFQYTFRLFNTKASETLVKTMRDTLFSHIERLPFSWHMKNKTGDIIQRCTSDIDTMKNFLSEQLTSIFRIIMLLVLSIAFMFSMNIKLSLIALAPLPIIIIYSFRFQRNIGSGFEKCDENEGKLSAMIQENLTGVRVVRAFGRERYEKDRFEKHNEYYTGLWVHLAKVMSRFWSTSDVLSGTQIMLLVVFGAVFCINGDLTSGEYIAFISYNSMLVWPIRQLGRMISEMSKAGVSIERIMYITESEKEKDRDGAIDADMTGDISFEHVSFSYEGCPEILHDINFTVKSGTTLGILGGTGSGKSTLMLLLDKLYDIPEGNGRITIGGTDIANIRTGHLRKNIGIVLQEPYLFSRTISENIGIAKDGTTLTQIREAAKAACLDETVSGFANGYDTFVGERGVTLSGGQKQRTAIARNLLQNAPIMIFDDSLSAVDTETDAKIRAELEKRFGSATIIIISHRITTLSKADKIIVLDSGRIVEEGTHDVLDR